MNHLQSQLYYSKDPISSSGPFASFDKSAAKVKLHCPEVLVFLRPLSNFGAGTSHSEASGPWPVFRGVLELDLPKMKRIEDIRVQCAFCSGTVKLLILLAYAFVDGSVSSTYELQPPGGKEEATFLTAI